jgi:hypothetical protein
MLLVTLMGCGQHLRLELKREVEILELEKKHFNLAWHAFGSEQAHVPSPTLR